MKAARGQTVYIPIEFNGEFAATGSPRHPKRDVTYLINIPYIFWICWKMAIAAFVLTISGFTTEKCCTFEKHETSQQEKEECRRTCT